MKWPVAPDPERLAAAFGATFDAVTCRPAQVVTLAAGSETAVVDTGPQDGIPVLFVGGTGTSAPPSRWSSSCRRPARRWGFAYSRSTGPDTEPLRSTRPQGMTSSRPPPSKSSTTSTPNASRSSASPEGAPSRGSRRRRGPVRGSDRSTSVLPTRGIRSPAGCSSSRGCGQMCAGWPRRRRSPIRSPGGISLRMPPCTGFPGSSRPRWPTPCAPSTSATVERIPTGSSTSWTSSPRRRSPTSPPSPRQCSSTRRRRHEGAVRLRRPVGGALPERRRRSSASPASATTCTTGTGARCSSTSPPPSTRCACSVGADGHT